jgi:hypothetical protein
MLKLWRKFTSLVVIVFIGIVVKTMFFADVQFGFAEPKPEMYVLQRLETILVMPKHTRPLHLYIRYYSQEIIQGEKYIVATFLYDGSPGRIELIESKKRPLIEDGGCDVLELRYSLSDNRVVSFACNGLG